MERELSIARNIVNSDEYVKLARDACNAAFFEATRLADTIDGKSTFKNYHVPVIFNMKTKKYETQQIQGSTFSGWEPEKAPNGIVITQPTVLEIDLRLFVNFDWSKYLGTLTGGTPQSITKYAKSRFFENIYGNKYLPIVKRETLRVIMDWENYFSGATQMKHNNNNANNRQY